MNLKLKVVFGLIFVLFFNLIIPTQNAKAVTWSYYGNSGFSAGSSTHINIALDSSNYPYVAYADGSLSDKLVVQKYSPGSGWVNVGSSSGITGGASYYNSIAFNTAKTTPYVAFKDNANSGKTSVLSYNGSAWANIGSAGFSSGTAEYVAMALDSSDAPYVAFQDGANSGKATVMKYNGSSWVTVGSAGFTAAIAEYVHIALDTSGLPYVVYRDTSVGNKASVMRYNGSAWVNVGTVGFSAGQSAYTDIVFTSTNEPYVVFQDASNSSKATVMRYNGSAWVNVGSAGFSSNTASSTRIARDSTNTPYVVFTDNGSSNKATVMKYNGSAWVNVDSAGLTAGVAAHTAIAISSTDQLFFAFQDGAASSKLSTFSTATAPTTPTVVNVDASSVGPTSITLSGNITSTGTLTVTERGFNWGTTVSYGNTLSESGSFSTGSYSLALSSLTCNTTYYFRAFATNSAGTATASGGTFITSRCPSVGGGILLPITPSSSEGELDFVVTDGSSITNKRDLQIKLNANPATVKGFVLSLDPTFAVDGIQPFNLVNNSVNFTLPDIEKEYTLYLKYYSLTGHTSKLLSKKITYKKTTRVLGIDTTAPNGLVLPVKQIPQELTFTRVLRKGMSGKDVEALQKYFISTGELIPVTNFNYGYFGPQTETAVKAFQLKNNIITKENLGYGVFGKKTRAKLYSLIGN